jgi:CubicO group peptidase (beta-lactamase class C family)
MLRQIRTLTVLLVLTLALLALPGCRGEELREQLDHYLTEARWIWGFHGSALVAYDGKVILSKGYGMASREFGELNTPKTKFFIGSITKQFTAAAIMILNQQGKLNLDDPISRYIPDYPKPAGDDITIHHLLVHTSGLPNYTDDPAILLWRTAPISPSALLRLFWERQLEFEPGSRFRYTNSGYIVLGAIIEAVSGQSYEAFLHHWIFGPLAMDNTGYARREAGLPDRADGFTSTEDLRMEEAVPIHYSVLHSAGALYSTVEDMLIWDQELYRHTILLTVSVDSMLTPRAGNYGYGFVIDSLYGRRHVHHGGFIDGFNSTFERWPDQKLCVIVFSNEEVAPVRKVAHGLAAIIFGESHDFPIEKEPITLPHDLLSEYTAVFDPGGNRYRYTVMEGDTVHTWMTGEPRMHLFPEAADTFFFEADNTRQFVFVRDDAGRIQAADVVDEGFRYRAPRVEPQLEQELLDRLQPMSIDPALYDDYIGMYQLETEPAIDVQGLYLRIFRRDGLLWVTNQYAAEIVLSARGKDDFFHEVGDFELSFVRGSDGQVTGCVLRMAGVEVVGRRVD